MDISKKILSDITVHMKYAKFLAEQSRRETWEELVTRNKKMHVKKYPDLKKHIDKDTLRFAINQEYLSENKKIYKNDEIAIFPPVSGG